MPRIRLPLQSRMIGSAALLVALGIPAAAVAEVVSVSAAGLLVRSIETIAAPPDVVYAALVKPAAWWSSDHTFSREAANLTLDAKAGGCFCETLLGNGSVEHQEVVLAWPGRQLVMRGALGPLQATATEDAFTFRLDPQGAGTQLTVTFTVAGYLPEGFEDWAKTTDLVVSTQAMRLKRFVETGSAEAAKQE